jgi:hypothetical protein
VKKFTTEILAVAGAAVNSALQKGPMFPLQKDLQISMGTILKYEMCPLVL